MPGSLQCSSYVVNYLAVYYPGLYWYIGTTRYLYSTYCPVGTFHNMATNVHKVVNSTLQILSFRLPTRQKEWSLRLLSLPMIFSDHKILMVRRLAVFVHFMSSCEVVMK